MSIKPCGLKITKDKREHELTETPLFPCGAYLSIISKDALLCIPWHWHDEIELIVVQSGSVSLHLNKTSFLLHQGEGAFVNAGILHSAQTNGNDRCILHTLVFEPSMIYGITENIIAQRYIRPLCSNRALSCIPLHPATEWQKQVLQCIKSAYTAFENEEFGFELLVWEHLSHVCYLIAKSMRSALTQQNQGETQDSVRIKKMLCFMHAHYEENLEVKQIAAIASISERQCLRCFQLILGMSPMQYLMQHRISITARLLHETSEPITAICNRCGFSSPSYFSSMFKRFFNLSPTAYRSAMQNSSCSETI